MTNIVEFHPKQPAARVLSTPISVSLRHHVERLIDPPTGFPRPAVSEVDRLEAETFLTTIGPLRMIGLARFGDWLEPFFVSAGSRASSADDQIKQTSALWDSVSDMPEEVFTAESRRAVAKLSEFVPTAKRIHDVMGADAAKVIAYHAALIRLAQPRPPSPAAPACPSAEEIAASAIEIREMVNAFKAELSDRRSPAPKTQAPMPSRPFAVIQAAELAAIRAANPLVQTALAHAANQKAGNSGIQQGD